jgi:predicted aminopeptidase
MSRTIRRSTNRSRSRWRKEGLKRWLDAQRDRPDAAQLAADVARSRLLARRIPLTDPQHARPADSGLREQRSDAVKRAGKAEAFKAMRTSYETLKSNVEGAQGFDRWFATGANNAGIAASALYDDRVPQFAALLAAEGGRPAALLRSG